MTKSKKPETTKIKIQDSLAGISKVRPEKAQDGQEQSGSTNNTQKK